MDKRVIIIITVLTVAAGFSGFFVLQQYLFSETTSTQQLSYEKINIIGELSEFGIYDPSVEYDDKGVGWLAYSASSSGEKADIETHLAKSTDHGRTWVYVSAINKTDEDTISLNRRSIDVIWRNETPTLVYDLDDPDKERRWKLFWAKGPALKGKTTKSTLWNYVYIAYKYASSPEKLALAEEIVLFNSEPQPALYKAKYNLDNFHSELKDTIFYMEPGSLVKDGVLYVTLSAVSLSGQKTILLSSFDHGRSWNYVGALIDNDEVIDPDYPILTASGVAEEDGRLFLLICPRRKTRPALYNGLYIFEFEDISLGKLKRDKEGNLIIHKYLKPALPQRFGFGAGQSEYHAQNTYGGIIMAQTVMNAKDKFQIYNTKKSIVEPKERMGYE